MCSRLAGIDPVGDQHPVRDDLPGPADPAIGGGACLLRDGDPLIDAIHQEPPDPHPAAHPAEVARGVVGRDDRGGRDREDGDADRRGHRLVQVEEIESLALEHAPDAEERARAEDDVRQRAVRGDDHRAADGDDVRRGLAMTTHPWMEDARELARRVVAHHQPDLVPARLEGPCLELGVLDDRPPERPRERHDDADLHLANPIDVRDPTVPHTQAMAFRL